jgi:hypothetical protein
MVIRPLWNEPWGNNSFVRLPISILSDICSRVCLDCYMVLCIPGNGPPWINGGLSFHICSE